MSKKTESSLKPLTSSDVSQLHQLLRDFVPVDGDIAAYTERMRISAFQVVGVPELFKFRYLQSQILKRYQHGTVSPEQRSSAALSGFVETELACRVVNDRLVDMFARAATPNHLVPLLKRAKLLIHQVLGSFCLDALPEACDFSSGASTDLPRAEAFVQKKWEVATHVTMKALPYALAFQQYGACLTAAEPYTSRKLEVVRGNRVFTVLKNYEKDRTCAKEPSWNMFLQKGVGELIRRRLQRFVGLLHPSAQFQHMQMAQEGSLHGRTATLDLRAASDSVTVALVAELLPPDWAKVILDLRSVEGFVPGHGWLTYEKVSSMGNGYTFELETLIFWALAASCCSKEERVSVYGDDMIVPSSRVRRITEVLKFCGFTLNPEKSFATGPFRESCGGHYWGGHNVKPFYIEQLPTTLPEVILLHNNIVEWHVGMRPIHRLVMIARACRRLVPREYWGPFGTAGCLWAEWDEARPRFVKGSRNKTSPAYCHWRVSTVRQENLVQKHDYYIGSFFADLWARRARGEDPSTRCSVRTMPYHLAVFARRLRKQESADVSTAEFTWSVRRFVKGWTAIGVGSQWPRLPVRI